MMAVNAMSVVSAKNTLIAMNGTIPAERADSAELAEWRFGPAVGRWRHNLLTVTGLTPAEIDNRVSVLRQFCVEHGFTPETMAAECVSGPDKVARRDVYLQAARAHPANLIVQSFLIHNGFNVFGDLVCMPHTPEQVLAEQGEQWLRHAQAQMA